MSSRHALTLAVLAMCAGATAAEAPLRDPMRPYGVTEQAPAASRQAPGFRVSAIFVSPTRRVAVINGRTVTVGEQIGGATVVAIGDGAVRLAYQGRTLNARLRKARIRE